ncbi:hypothetical protein BAE44_0005350 [Dichanthelium oligosanthes]|uniref:Uncharacterized protein n=1 Tax=Dichanthelium oligosanthes TaxID=888268 RepID=A0A1E5W8A1_9POAL|nr:hypothetical protein BAE44_0005350 [Dichanthelium oligosanthes]
MDAPRGVAAVLSEALCLARRSKKHMLPCLLLALIPSSLQLVGNHVSVYSLLLGFIARLHSLGRENPVMPRFYDLLLRLKSDADSLSHVNAALAVTAHLSQFASTVVIVHAASAACAGRHLPVEDLRLKLAASWKGPLVTYLYSTLLSVGYTALSVALIAVPALNMAAAGGPSSSRLAVVAAAAIAAAARFLYVYLAMVWAVGVVVSVVEDGCRGLEALHRAGEAVGARRAQGFLIALALAIANAFVGFGSRGWRGAFACAVHLLLGMFSPVVYTVFYHECKRSSQGDGAPPELSHSHHTKADHDHGTSSEGVV